MRPPAGSLGCPEHGRELNAGAGVGRLGAFAAVYCHSDQLGSSESPVSWLISSTINWLKNRSNVASPTPPTITPIMFVIALAPLTISASPPKQLAPATHIRRNRFFVVIKKYIRPTKSNETTISPTPNIFYLLLFSSDFPFCQAAYRAHNWRLREHALSPGTLRARGGVADSNSGGNGLATLHRVDDGQDGVSSAAGPGRVWAPRLGGVLRPVPRRHDQLAITHSISRQNQPTIAITHIGHTCHRHDAPEQPGLSVDLGLSLAGNPPRDGDDRQAEKHDWVVRRLQPSRFSCI